MRMIDDLSPTHASANLREVLSSDEKIRIRPEWRWHYKALLDLRESLLERRAELADSIMGTSEPLDTADLAAEDFNHDLALGQLSGEQDVLYEIQAALSRICAGAYGRCEVTGEAIPAARLRAIPWTRFSQAVEETLEQEQTLRPPHLGELHSLTQKITRCADADIPEEEEVI